MTMNEFNAQCSERYIDVNLALENEAIVEALRRRDNAQVLILLDTEF